MIGLTRRGLLAAPVAASVSVPGKSPDAELIALCDQMPAALAAIVASPDDLPDDAPEWRLFDQIADAVQGGRPTTLEGIIAKARATMAQAEHCGDVEEREPDGAVAIWSWRIVRDLLRLSTDKLRQRDAVSGGAL